MQERLSNDEFFSRLAELLSKTTDHGSVNLTQKRLSYDESNPPPTLPKTKGSKLIRQRPLSPTDLSDISSIFSSNTTTSTAPTSLASSIIGLDNDDDATPRDNQKYPILIRATNCKSNDKRHSGKKVKIATVVESDDLEAFFAKYSETCKAGLTALKKKDKKKKKKKQKARKQKKAAAEGGAGAAPAPEAKA